MFPWQWLLGKKEGTAYLRLSSRIRWKLCSLECVDFCRCNSWVLQYRNSRNAVLFFFSMIKEVYIIEQMHVYMDCWDTTFLGVIDVRGFHVSLSCASKYRYLEFKCCSAALFPDNEHSDCIFFFHWRQRLCKAVCLNWTLSVMTKATARKKRALLKVDFLWSPSRLLTSISFSPFLLCYSLSHIYNAASSFFFSSVLVARVLFSDIRSCCCAPCKTHTHKYTRHEKKKWKPEVF